MISRLAEVKSHICSQKRNFFWLIGPLGRGILSWLHLSFQEECSGESNSTFNLEQEYFIHFFGESNAEWEFASTSLYVTRVKRGDGIFDVADSVVLVDDIFDGGALVANEIHRQVTCIESLIHVDVDFTSQGLVSKKTCLIICEENSHATSRESW